MSVVNIMPALIPIATVPSRTDFRAVLDAVPCFNLKVGKDNLPLTQLQGWATRKALFFHCSAYETAPAFESGFTLNLFPQKENRKSYLTIDFTPESFKFKISGAPSPEAVSLFRDGGENQQGAFWGGTLCIPVSLLQALNPDFTVTRGNIINGNFYKYCTVLPNIYYASLFDSAGGNFIISGY